VRGGPAFFKAPHCTGPADRYKKLDDPTHPLALSRHTGIRLTRRHRRGTARNRIADMGRVRAAQRSRTEASAARASAQPG